MVDQSYPTRVFVSYAQHAAPGHDAAVLRLYQFLRECGIDARLDLPAAAQRQDWALWMAEQIREADFILVIASAAYRERAEGRSGPDIGRGVQWEARLIRNAFYQDQHRLDRFVPVVLPGQDVDGLPEYLGPATSTVYHVSDFTVSGAEALLRFLTGQPAIVEPPLGQVPMLGPLSIPTSTDVYPRHLPDPVVQNVITGTVTGTAIQAGNIGALSITGSGGWQAPVRAHVVGVGVDGWQLPFQNQYLALRRHLELGEPTTDVDVYPPGVRQKFSGGWVLCALRDGRRVLAVTEKIWDALFIVGDGTTAEVGFPVSDGAEFIDDNAVWVDLSGGTRGPGWLWRRGPSRQWKWRARSTP